MKIWVVLKSLKKDYQAKNSILVPWPVKKIVIKSINMSKFLLTGGFQWKDLKEFDLLWLNKFTSNSSKDNVLNIPKFILNIQKNYLYYSIFIF